MKEKRSIDFRSEKWNRYEILEALEALLSNEFSGVILLIQPFSSAASSLKPIVDTTITIEFDASLQTFEDFVYALKHRLKSRDISVVDWSDDENIPQDLLSRIKRMLQAMGLRHSGGG